MCTILWQFQKQCSIMFYWIWITRVIGYTQIRPHNLSFLHFTAAVKLFNLDRRFRLTPSWTSFPEGLGGWVRSMGYYRRFIKLINYHDYSCSNRQLCYFNAYVRCRHCVHICKSLVGILVVPITKSKSGVKLYICALPSRYPIFVCGTKMISRANFENRSSTMYCYWIRYFIWILIHRGTR